MPTLSVIIPVYNEIKTIRQILEKINSVPVDKEIIVVDDSSSDGTGKLLRDMRDPNLKIIHHSSNRGKGAAVLTGLNNASGEYVIIQDADLEYDPAEYLKLIEAIKKEGADLVMGARFTKGYNGLFIPILGNRFLTGMLNILFGTHFNDYLTCYKLLRRDVAGALNLNSSGFSIDTEIVAKILKKKMRIIEVPVAYYPRSYKEGKKIRIMDGLRHIGSILKYRFWR